MKYMGSKSREAKQIVPLIQQEVDKIGRYWEPFCGGCNIIDKIVAEEKIASDNHYYLIEMWKHLQETTEDLPDSVSWDDYDAVRKNIEAYPAWYVGWVGFIASYNGRFFDGGYAKTIVSKTGVLRNYYDEARRNILKQVPLVNAVKFFHSDYKNISPEGYVIYCDPPYKGTKQYAFREKFDWDSFWETMREWSQKNIVFVSEENAPSDFECIWEKEVTRTQDNRKRSIAVEKLFRKG